MQALPEEENPARVVVVRVQIPVVEVELVVVGVEVQRVLGALPVRCFFSSTSHQRHNMDTLRLLNFMWSQGGHQEETRSAYIFRIRSDNHMNWQTLIRFQRYIISATPIIATKGVREPEYMSLLSGYSIAKKKPPWLGGLMIEFVDAFHKQSLIFVGSPSSIGKYTFLFLL